MNKLLTLLLSSLRTQCQAIVAVIDLVLEEGSKEVKVEDLVEVSAATEDAGCKHPESSRQSIGVMGNPHLQRCGQCGEMLNTAIREE